MASAKLAKAHALLEDLVQKSPIQLGEYYNEVRYAIQKYCAETRAMLELWLFYADVQSARSAKLEAVRVVRRKYSGDDSNYSKNISILCDWWEDLLLTAKAEPFGQIDGCGFPSTLPQAVRDQMRLSNYLETVPEIIEMYSEGVDNAEKCQSLMRLTEPILLRPQAVGRKTGRGVINGWKRGAKTCSFALLSVKARADVFPQIFEAYADYWLELRTVWSGPTLASVPEGRTLSGQKSNTGQSLTVGKKESIQVTLSTQWCHLCSEEGS